MECIVFKEYVNFTGRRPFKLVSVGTENEYLSIHILLKGKRVIDIRKEDAFKSTRNLGKGKKCFSKNQTNSKCIGTIFELMHIFLYSTKKLAVFGHVFVFGC